MKYPFQTTTDAEEDLSKLMSIILDRQPMSYIRFSDGEMAILNGEPFSIGSGYTKWRGKSYANIYPGCDAKSFDPAVDTDVYSDLLEAAKNRDCLLIKGIPTSHNRVPHDTLQMMRWNGSIENITFSDIFINSNYRKFRSIYSQDLLNAADCIIANHRATLRVKKRIIPIRDNFFLDYIRQRDEVIEQLISLPRGSLVLSSASSLSNVIGSRILYFRRDLTFVDIGTSLNDFFGLPFFTRPYQFLEAKFFSNPLVYLKARKYQCSPEYKIKW